MAIDVIDDTQEKDPVKKVEWDNVKTSGDIDDLLTGYTGSIVTNQNDEQKEESNVNSSPQNSVTGEDKSDPSLYYQTGKKKGQLRPKAKVTKKAPYDNATVSGELISGVLFITLIDMLFPILIALINNRFSDDHIKAEKLKLTAKQRNELAPVCDEIVKKWDLTANPIAILLVSMSGIYGMNFLAAKSLSE